MNEILKNSETIPSKTNKVKSVNFTSVEKKLNEIENIIGNANDWKEFYVDKMNKILEKKIPWVKLIINNWKIEISSDIWKDELNEIMNILINKQDLIENKEKKDIDLNKTTSWQLLNEHQKQISMWNVNFLKELLLKNEWDNEYRVDFKDNTEAELQIGLADILPINVRKVRVQWNFEWENYDLTGERIWDKWWFYSYKHDYLPVYHWFKITIIEEWSEDEIKNSKEKLNKNIEEFKKTDYYKSCKENFDENTLDKLAKSAFEYNLNPVNLIWLYKLKQENKKDYSQIKNWIDSTDWEISITCKKIQQWMSEFYKVWWKNITNNQLELNPEFILFMKHLSPNWLKWTNENVLKTITNKEYSPDEIKNIKWNINEQIINITNIYTNFWENNDVETIYWDVIEWYEWKYDPREVFSEPFERSPSWTTLCGKTARLNYSKFWWNCRRWDAISLVNDPEYNWWQVHKRARAVFLLESWFDNKSFYHVSIAKNDWKHWREEARNGHSFVVFKWNDWETYVLDPYYFGWSNKPHKLSQHPLTYNMKYWNSKWAIHKS